MHAWSCLRTVRYEKRYAAACFTPKAAKSICEWLDPGLVSEKRKTPHLPFPQRTPVVQTRTQSAPGRTRAFRPPRDASGIGPGVGIPSGTPRRPQAPPGTVTKGLKRSGRTISKRWKWTLPVPPWRAATRSGPPRGRAGLGRDELMARRDSSRPFTKGRLTVRPDGPARTSS